MSLPPHLPPAGWYPDPAGSGALRWWDGARWSAHVQHPYGGAGGGWSPVAAVGGGVVEEERTAGTARTALVVGLVAYSVSLLASAVQLLSFWQDPADMFGAGGTSQATGAAVGVGLLAAAVSQLASLAALVAGVLYLTWFHRAATVARSLGIPAQYQPVWAVLGFIIPVINLWFPYLVARDLFPSSRAEDRSLVGRWWGFYLAASFSSLAVFLGVLVAPGLGIVLAVVGVALWVQAYLLARQVVDRSLAVHQAVARGELGAMSAWGVHLGPA